LCLSLGLRLLLRLSLPPSHGGCLGKGFIGWFGGHPSLYLSRLRPLLRLSLGRCPGNGFIDWLGIATTHLAKSEIFGPECRRNGEIHEEDEEDTRRTRGGAWHQHWRRWHRQLSSQEAGQPAQRLLPARLSTVAIEGGA